MMGKYEFRALAGRVYFPQINCELASRSSKFSRIFLKPKFFCFFSSKKRRERVLFFKEKHKRDFFSLQDL
jgi:hypothetical protein